MARIRFTQQAIEALPLPSQGYALYWDTGLRGFGLRVQPSGKKLYLIQYRNRYGVTKRCRVGEHGLISFQQARAEVIKLLGGVEIGADPGAERIQIKEAETMATLCELYLTKHCEIKKKASSIKLDRWIISKHLLPQFGTRKVQDISRTDIHQFHYALRNTPTQANRILEVLSKMFNLAEKWGIRPDYSNPCRHVEKYPERKVERFLSAEELKRLDQVLAEREADGSESTYVIAAFRLLMLTGCRLGEIQFLKWDYVDLERSVIRLPDSKTGAKSVMLNEGSLAILKNLQRHPTSPFVIVNEVTGNAVQNMQKPWSRIRRKAGFEDVRIHDLRHTFASNAVAAGLSLTVIGKLLGHNQPQTTQRYAHLALTSQQEAANLVGQSIVSAFRA